MQRLCRVLTIKCASIQMPSRCVACVLNRTTPFPTLIFAINFGRRCLLWPRLHMTSAASVFAVSNCSPRLLAHSMFLGTRLSTIVTTWLTSLPVANLPTISSTDSLSASYPYSLTHAISPEKEIAKRIGDPGEPSGTPASSGCLSMVWPSISIATILCERTLSVLRIMSPFICLTFIKLSGLRFGTLGKAALMSMRSTPGMWPFVQPAWALSTMMAAASMADRPFLLPNCQWHNSLLLLASSDSSSAATFLTTIQMQLSSDIER